MKPSIAFIFLFVMAFISMETTISTKGIKSISLLGSDEKIKWERTNGGLTIHTPSRIPSEYALAFKIELKGDWVE